MSDLIIKPSIGPGNKLILQDQAGGAILTTADSGAVITNTTEVTFVEKAAANANVATKGEVWVKSTTPNTLFFTDDAGTDVGLGTSHAPAGTSITGNSLGVTAANDTAATLFIKADNSDDAGDDWTIVSNTNQTLTIENDVASAGTGVAMLTITPDATGQSQVGIGTVPTSLLNIKGTSPTFILENPTNQSISDGTDLGRISWYVDDDSGSRNREQGAYIKYEADYSDGNSGNWHGGETDGSLRFGLLDVEGSSGMRDNIMTIAHTGNVGIGTAAPIHTLDIGGANGIAVRDAGVNDVSLMFQAKHPSAGWQHYGTGYATKISQYSSGLSFDVVGTASADASITWINAITIAPTGNVGIGTTAPASYYFNDLVVSNSASGGITMVADPTNGVSTLAFADGTSGTSRYDGSIDYSHSARALGFHTAGGVRRMTIDSSGAVIFNGGVVEKTGNASASGTTVTVDLATGNFFAINLSSGVSGAITTFTTNNTNQTTGQISNFILKVTCSASYDFNWGSLTNFKWPAATPPTLTATNGAIDILSFTTYDLGSTWYGQLVGQEFS